MDAHVVLGDSAAGSLRLAWGFQESEIFIFRDTLSCGHVQPVRNLDEWRQARRSYWGRTAEAHGEIFDLPRDILNHSQQLARSSNITVWMARRTDEHLMLAWLLQVLRLTGRGTQSVRIVEFESVDTRSGGKSPVWGLSSVHPTQLREHSSYKSLSDDAIVELDQAWAAAIAPDPQELLTFLSSKPRCLPNVHTGLRAILQRYPHPRFGLGRWKFELLKNTELHGPTAARVVGITMGDCEGPDMPGDAYLFSCLQDLGDPRLPSPLIEINGSSSVLRDCRVNITNSGREVLEGQQNNIGLNGIDEWILGVHVCSREHRVWYHSDGTLLPKDTEPDDA